MWGERPDESLRYSGRIFRIRKRTRRHDTLNPNNSPAITDLFSFQVPRTCLGSREINHTRTISGWSYGTEVSFWWEEGELFFFFIVGLIGNIIAQSQEVLIETGRTETWKLKLARHRLPLSSNENWKPIIGLFFILLTILPVRGIVSERGRGHPV